MKISGHIAFLVVLFTSCNFQFNYAAAYTGDVTAAREELDAARTKKKTIAKKLEQAKAEGKKSDVIEEIKADLVAAKDALDTAKANLQAAKAQPPPAATFYDPEDPPKPSDFCPTPAVPGPKELKSADLEQYAFEDYIREFGKEYDGDEYKKREASFLEKLKEIRSHNDDGTTIYKKGVNFLSDYTDDELQKMKGLDKSLLFYADQQREQDETRIRRNLKALPDHVDWRDQGVITPVKNQGWCGSCWAFASVETLESQWAIKTGILQELSEQFVLDCTPNPDQCGGTGGCSGGTASLAYDRLVEIGGIPSEWTYPYLSALGDPGECHGLPLPPAKPHSGVVSAATTITGYRSTTPNSYADMMYTLATVGPLVISVDAEGWHDYSSGIFDGRNTKQNQTNPVLDHAVQLVGYGTDEETGQDYWLVRNTWTSLWGEKGYIRILREEDAPCGIDYNPLDGDGCVGGPSEVEVCGQSGILYGGTWPEVCS